MVVELPFTAFQYSSHLEFVRDAYEYTHAQDESFSYDKLATECSLKSRTEARNLIKGIKPFTEGSLSRVAEIFLLDQNQKSYLICLLRFQNAGNSPAAYEIFQNLMAAQGRRALGSNPFRRIEIATSVLHMTLLTAMELPGIDDSPEALSQLLKGRYTSLQISDTLQELQEYGYIKRDNLTGKYLPCQKHIQKYDQNANFFLQRYHTESLNIAKSALENEPSPDRYLVGASFSVNHKVFPRIVQKMNSFVENLMLLDGVAGPPDMVVQLSQQLIQMTRHPEQNIEPGLRPSRSERELNQGDKSVIVETRLGTGER